MRFLNAVTNTRNLLVESIFPSKCAICGMLAPCAICSECEKEFDFRPFMESSALQNITTISNAFVYEEFPAEAVKRLKYERVSSLAEPMSQSLRRVYDQFELSTAEIIIPVPIHWRRLGMRGFNQSDLLCESLPSRKVKMEWLRRVRFTKPQVQIAPEERLTNLAGAFKAVEDFSGISVLLVDDVMTSGGTAKACAEALRLAGATKIDLLVYARSKSDAMAAE